MLSCTPAEIQFVLKPNCFQAVYLESKAIIEAFASSAFKEANITLDFLEYVFIRSHDTFKAELLKGGK